MRRRDYVLELESDAVISRTSGTAGGHQSLDYVPGAVILGVVAGKIYSRDQNRALTLFHSGKVRFGSAYPLAVGDVAAYPMPLSLHRAKRDERQPELLLHNLAVGDPEDGVQMQQMREGDGFFTLEGKLVSVASTMVVKTAVDASTRRAKQGHLFAYQALRAWTRFGFSVSVDDGVDRELEKLIEDTLTTGSLAIGRSRSAEFGWARVTRRSVAQPSVPIAAIRDGRLVVLARTDLALLDQETGQPTLQPSPRHFLPEKLSMVARVNWHHSFLRSRRYSPFNGKRRRPDLERQVIVKGSVIVLEGIPADTDAESLARRLEAGVGAYRESGLGEVWIQPPPLMKGALRWQRGTAEPSACSDAPEDSDKVIPWLRAVAGRKVEELAAARLAREWARDLVDVTPRHGGPGPSQWGMIRERAALAPRAAELWKDLFEPAVGLLHKGVRARPWTQRYRGHSVGEVLGRQVAQEIAARGPKKDWVVLRAVRLLAMRMPRELSAAGRAR